MTPAQKIIKYFATAFVAFLVVIILSAILSGAFGIMSALGIVNAGKDEITEDLQVIASEVNNLSTLKIDLAFINLEIKTADTFRIETNNSKISFIENNGSVEIKDCEISNLKANLGMGEFAFSGKATERNKIDSGIGAIRIELMDTKQNYTVDVKKGIGNIMIDGQIIETDRIYGAGEII